ncbi:hypothetical protein FTUN_7184 [Frigoriglobus tundricola]|uniref:Uncharacterized protein n=1 Tax=Frigoriglobus tundricola TaxID=2774151 RepID=A0A6M5Z2Z1_9BACT|nr:hypothetical protein FTUN_7184 [Frigoriglobus tundricola]
MMEGQFSQRDLVAKEKYKVPRMNTASADQNKNSFSSDLRSLCSSVALCSHSESGPRQLRHDQP